MTEEQLIFEAYTKTLNENRDFENEDVDNIYEFLIDSSPKTEEEIVRAKNALLKICLEVEDFDMISHYTLKHHPDVRWYELEEEFEKIYKDIDSYYDSGSDDDTVKNQLIVFGLNYAINNIKGRWKALEEAIFTVDDPKDLMDGIFIQYLLNCVNGRWKEFERYVESVFENIDFKKIFIEFIDMFYVPFLDNKGWPELEPHLKSEPNYKKIIHRRITDKDAYLDNIDDILDDYL